MDISSGTGSFGSLLKTLRTARHLTQQQLADRLGVRRNTLGSWERGDFLPGSKAQVLELARHLRLDEQESVLLLEASLTALAPHWLVTAPRNLYFTGREEILEALHAELGVDQTAALTQSVALQGLGGIGKTQIALEYAYRYVLEYSAVFWIGAETIETITSGLLGIAEVVRLPGRDDPDQSHVVAAVQRWLSTHGQWLLIWDNVEDLEILRRFLPSTRSGAMLITTRLQALGVLARSIDLLPMEQEEGVFFLLRRAKVLAYEARREQMRQLAVRQPAQYAAAVQLVEIMGGLPLAMDQAGAYLEETRCGLPGYLDLFRSQQAALLQQRGESAHDHLASVSTTFTLAIAATASRHPAVWDLLWVCACLQPDAIPEELFRQGAEHLGPSLEAICGDTLKWDRLVGMACSYSLLSRQPGEQTLSLHQLVQVVLLDGMTRTEQERWRTRVIEALNKVFPQIGPTTEYTLRKRCNRVLTHTLHCLRQVEPTEESLALASLAYKTAHALDARAQYAEAEPLHLQALHIREQALGPDHLQTASSLNYLSTLYREQGKYAEAEPLGLRAVHIREQVLGPDHPEVAGSLNNLALLYWVQGRYTEAETFYLRALQILTQAQDASYPELGSSLNNLAILYWIQGRYTEAEALHLRALQIREQALGSDHPQTASSLDNLAILYRDLGRLTEAEPLSLRALRIREQTLGLDHPEVANSLNNLAELYRDLGRRTEAEALYLRALQIQEQVQGPNHPGVAFPLTNLATLYFERGQYPRAEQFYLKALSIWEPALGMEHLHLGEPLTGLANLYQEQGKYAESEAYYRRALAIRERRLEPHHPDLAETLSGLALLQQRQGHLSEALSLAQRTLAIRAQSLGSTHPKTVATRTLCDQLLQEKE